jgi:hypothetical protein
MQDFLIRPLVVTNSGDVTSTAPVDSPRVVAEVVKNIR